MKLVFLLIVIFAAYYFCNNIQDPATDKSLFLSDRNAEANRQEIIRYAKENRMEGCPEYTDEERHIVFAREYERLDATPDFIVVVFIILVGFGWWAIFGANPFNALVSILCCLVLFVFGYYQWIVLAALIDIVFIPMAQAAIVSSLFKQD